MKIAIIYTGETRTIEKTIDYFKSNVLLNENCHVFAVLQSNNVDFHDNYVKTHLGDNLKSLSWFDKNNQLWCDIREHLLYNMDISEDWKNYLRNSGSMIEYYQMYLAFKEIEKIEHLYNYKYEYMYLINPFN